MHAQRRRLGQVFLVDRNVAIAEAAHADNKTILEIGPGRGMLTRELCEVAHRVIAIEKDASLYDHLKRTLKYKNLKLINADFFDVKEEEMELGKVDMLISNVPYSLSGRIIEWISKHGKDAVLCLQKEFAEHMAAKEGTREYSRLSVMSSLTLRTTEIMDVPKGCFSPIPKVDSKAIFIKCRNVQLSDAEREVINALMQHKKKTVRNAILNSRVHLGISRESMREVADTAGVKDKRLFKLSPEAILELARVVIKAKNQKA